MPVQRREVKRDELDARTGGVPVTLTHGRWSLEVRGDEVADLSFDGVRLIRAVRPVVRDRDWNTVPVTVEAQQRSEDVGSIRFVSRLLFQAAEICYRATVTVTISADAVAVDLHGQAVTTFDRNRIGLVVLHPASDAGRAVNAHHTGGRVVGARWPTEISPHQPFRDLTGFGWTKEGVGASLALSGDVFETEDQRNWTDASFKTYSTPLDLAFPVTVVAGETCQQQVRLTAHGSATPKDRPAQHTVTISSRDAGTMPPISLGAALYPPPARLVTHSAPYEAVLVELTDREDRWPDLLATATRQADAFGSALDVRLVTDDLDAVGRAVEMLPLDRVIRLAVFDPPSHVTTTALWEALGESGRDRGFRGQLVAGTRAHFTELNRLLDQLPVDAPALTFSLTPQMHATEIPHILDSLTTQTTVAENALRLAGGRPVHVGPITLARRFNAVATSGAADPAADAARAVDPLLASRFGAAWTLGSVAALASTGVASLCYFETVGPRGIRSDDEPDLPGDEGAPPVAAVLDTLASLRGRPILETSAPPGVTALAVRTPTGDVRLLVANLSADPRTVQVLSPAGHGSALEPGGWAVVDTVLRSD